MGADRWGVSDGYVDGAGTWHDASPVAVAAVRAALGVDAEVPRDPGNVWVLRVGADRVVHSPATLRTEDGGEVVLRPGDALPPDVPFGYHDLVLHDADRVVRVIVAPDACHLPADLHTWGWAVQLYATRSRRSWGIGDLRDLRTLNEWSARHGSGMVLVNPLHATTPLPSQQPSPYFPSSRVYRNPLYLALEEVPGWSDLASDLEPVAVQARALDADRRIDRDAVFRCKDAALARLWERWRSRNDDDHARFDSWVRSEGRALVDFATHSAIVEVEQSPWSSWSADLRRPDGPGIDRVRRERADRIGFHQWGQWLLDDQLSHAGGGLDLMTDLAIGVDRGGADAWVWQDAFALSVSVGAPPDDFNGNGQDWGLPPFDPWRLRDAAYEPFIRTVRAAFRHSGGVRMDHVMGLFRLFWIPEGMGPVDGCYVYMPHRDLLSIVALESHRAGAYVVGEDLGTIEPYVREELARTSILSYRLVQFEDEPSWSMPHHALTAFSTHDLPTIAGYWTGSDLAAQDAIGLSPNVEGMRWLRRSMARRAGFADVADLGDELAPGQADPSVDELSLGVHRDLAQAPSMLVTATLDDVLGVAERPNIPGTVDEWPNWRIALPLPLEDVLEDERTARIAAVLADRPGGR